VRIPAVASAGRSWIEVKACEAIAQSANAPTAAHGVGATPFARTETSSDPA
jgi:hypothetical protein